MLDIPSLPGLYIVTVECDVPMSVNAHNTHIADKCIFIDRRNCKFGRARSLQARCRNYFKTFFPHQVNFRVVALLDDINAAEGACATKLKPWRVRGRPGDSMSGCWASPRLRSRSSSSIRLRRRGLILRRHVQEVTRDPDEQCSLLFE